MKLLSFIFGVTILTFFLGLASPNKINALSGSQFKADRIIDDALFYKNGDLSGSQIQNFLNKKVPTCDSNGAKIYSGSTTRKQYAASKGVSTPFVCLKSYKQTTPARSDPLNLCSSVPTRSNRSAAAIIYDVSKACGVSTKTLIVLLEKEQSLITDDWPWPIQYRSATGYGCPDTAPCDSQYYGFFNQVYNAARQFKRYRSYSNDFNYQAGTTNYIQWHPSSSCGGSNIYIKNHATAALYNYTPYQPNSPALSNLYGTGNSCSSYGNRNFWRLYNDWFGKTLVNSAPDIPISGDWDGDGTDEMGLKRLDEFLLNYTNNSTADFDLIYGLPSDKGLSGDWNNNNSDTIGVKRGNIYYLNFDNDNDSERIFSYGRTTDYAISGDWDGDGTDEIAIKRGNMYYLNYDNDGTANVVFSYGRSTDIPISGDWDGDGTDEIAIKRGNMYYLNYDNDGTANVVFSYGRSTDIPISGDWDGDGTDEIAIKRGNMYYLNYDNDGTANVVFSYGR